MDIGNKHGYPRSNPGETAYISHGVNDLGKCMNPTAPPVPEIGK